MPPPRRQKSGYFPTASGDPAPLTARVTHRVHFSDVDPMAVLWHGRYANLFEAANEELGRLCHLTYADFFQAKLRAPIVQLHVDYHAPATLSELLTITARMIWTDAARINIEYEIHKQNTTLAASGYTVQMFIDEAGTPLIASPDLLETCRTRWRSGAFGGA